MNLNTSPCNGNCDQGRACDCAPPTISGRTLVMAVILGLMAWAIVAAVLIVFVGAV